MFKWLNGTWLTWSWFPSTLPPRSYLLPSVSRLFGWLPFLLTHFLLPYFMDISTMKFYAISLWINIHVYCFVHMVRKLKCTVAFCCQRWHNQTSVTVHQITAFPLALLSMANTRMLHYSLYHFLLPESSRDRLSTHRDFLWEWPCSFLPENAPASFSSKVEDLGIAK